MTLHHLFFSLRLLGHVEPYCLTNIELISYYVLWVKLYSLLYVYVELLAPIISVVAIVVGRLLSHVWLFVTQWTAGMPGFPVLHHLLGLAQTHVHWVGDVIQPSRPLLSPFPTCLQFFPASGSFPMSQFFVSGGQSIWVSVSASVLSVYIQDWFPLGWTGWISLQSKGFSRVFSNNTVQKHQFSTLSFLYSPTLIFIHDYWKNHSFD